MGSILLNLVLLLIGAKANASSCCGQAASTFIVLNQQEKLFARVGYSYSEALGRVYQGSDFHVWSGDKDRVVQTWSSTLATTWSMHHQAFLNFAVQSSSFRNQGKESQADEVSDTLIGYTYEVLPEYTFSYWRPNLFLSTFVNLPTGKSIYSQSSLSEGVGVTGHEQWGVGLGLTLQKVIFPWTLLLQAKTLRLFEEEFDETKVSSFYDSSLSGNLTYATPWSWTLSGGLIWNHLSPRRLAPQGVRSLGSESTTVTAAVQYILAEEWNIGVSVSDQSLLGNPKNTLLERSISMSLNYKYF